MCTGSKKERKGVWPRVRRGVAGEIMQEKKEKLGYYGKWAVSRVW